MQHRLAVHVVPLLAKNKKAHGLAQHGPTRHTLFSAICWNDNSWRCMRCLFFLFLVCETA